MDLEGFAPELFILSIYSILQETYCFRQATYKYFVIYEMSI